MDRRTGITGDMEFRVKESIYCALRDALRENKANAKLDGHNALPDSYGVQMQLSFTVDENTSVSPGVTYNNTLSNALASGVSVGQSFNLGASGTFSGTATRTDTLYSYYNIGKITVDDPKSSCGTPDQLADAHGSSPFFQPDIGIKAFLRQAVEANEFLDSSKGGAKDAKKQIFSYEMKFVIITNGSITPTWKLVRISANTGGPFFSTGRTRTHDLTVTFGPGADSPDPTAVQAHFNQQLLQALNRIAQH